ncbi:hypothetical protein ACIRRH_18815 [Kitasatospora sp. NPDC101235]|uniref:hypothetical protein n=1 Tax=Kitasatospora sp. NPDC101235 TaxID=3364101 RepID=UPI0037FB0869
MGEWKIGEMEVMPFISCNITLHNHTGNDMFVNDFGLSHGEWHDGVLPDAAVGDRARSQWQSDSRGTATGTEGFIDYRLGGGPAGPGPTVIHVHWDVPFIGSNSMDVNVPDSIQAQFTNNSGNNVDNSITLLPKDE